MAATTPPIKQDEINAILWKACDTFRGTIAPSEYKNYIMVMLFLKYIQRLLALTRSGWREQALATQSFHAILSLKEHRMPKLYEYFGLIVLFYSNEHEPIHVHGKYQDMESRAEIIIDHGEVVEIRFGSVRGRRPLSPAQLRDFEVLVERFAEEIVQKWIDYFVLHKPVPAETITRRLR